MHPIWNGTRSWEYILSVLRGHTQLDGTPCVSSCLISRRHLRLFACACARLLWHQMGRTAQRLVELAEDWADVPSGLSELSVPQELQGLRKTVLQWASLRDCRRVAYAVAQDRTQINDHMVAMTVPRDVLLNDNSQRLAIVAILQDLVGDRPWDTGETMQRVIGPNSPLGCSRATEYPLHDMAINPPGPNGPQYRTILNGMIHDTLIRMYMARDFSDLPIVADMLEETDSANALYLDHLRSPGPHYRGCWAVDALLGKPW